MGFNSAFLPNCLFILTGFSKFNISDPYPLPFSYKNSWDIPPLITGVAVMTPTLVLASS